MTAGLELEMARRTHPGMVRPHNEDSVRIAPPIGLAVLADGLGGYQAGEVASEMATSMLHELLVGDLGVPRSPGRNISTHRLLRLRITEVNRAIFRAAQNRAECYRMATTLVLALFADNTVTAAHVGDSRLYRLRGDSLTCITRDHSRLQDKIDAGIVTADEARYSRDKNLVTRALGVSGEVAIDIARHEVLSGDIYLLCSDGLTDMVADSEIREVLLPPGINLDEAADGLVRKANENGGRDNVSVILIRARLGAASKGNRLTRFIWRLITGGGAWRN